MHLLIGTGYRKGVENKALGFLSILSNLEAVFKVEVLLINAE
jgi:hypothetical protein